ncbi:hypothetical protein K6731_19935 [Escherichia whittamii]|uniref:Peptide ABC transporter ATP-binding protein n=1 Tax=Escherichia whittamii TaxID=2762229 RepID=A0ABR8TDA2_9ESCH|nr:MULTISPECIES: hypothetical protein [Escherichia]EEZ4384087.1 hypothetical protein [Escherichia coli]MBD7973721.1 hypothetical protein [Escherichia whittamii]MCA4893019.1 hypothetical protein [Escherichia whittamii]MEB7937199.1 hypothetical protein [Escherichia whittamii]QLX42558.1 hypothetical protein HV146_00100 [Escherichia coli]
MAESVKQICLMAHIITGKRVPEPLKLAKIKTLLKIADKKSPTKLAGQRE